jgi:hypothetical protein
LETCQLSDLGFIGSKFTWCNNKEDEYFTKERLDRVVANLEWCEFFGETDTFVLAAGSSDHCPLSLHYGGKLEDNRWSTENFKFEASWMVNDDCLDTITKGWGDNSQGRDNLDIVLNKLEQCKRALVKWSRRRKARAMLVWVRKQTKRIEKLQESIEPDIVSERKGYQAAIDDRLERDELRWMQRAKVHWLQLGDCNTKFFHMYANQRKKVNHVSEVEDANGVICTNAVNISRAFMEYY